MPPWSPGGAPGSNSLPSTSPGPPSTGLGNMPRGDLPAPPSNSARCATRPAIVGVKISGGGIRSRRISSTVTSAGRHPKVPHWVQVQPSLDRFIISVPTNPSPAHHSNEAISTRASPCTSNFRLVSQVHCWGTGPTVSRAVQAHTRNQSRYQPTAYALDDARATGALGIGHPRSGGERASARYPSTDGPPRRSDRRGDAPRNATQLDNSAAHSCRSIGVSPARFRRLSRWRR
jgi:hypothetical protein